MAPQKFNSGVAKYQTLITSVYIVFNNYPLQLCIINTYR